MALPKSFLTTELPDPCLIFRSVRDGVGALLDFHGEALNPAAEAIVESLGRALSAWRGVEGLPEHGVWRGLVEGADGAALAFELHGHLARSERWYRARAVKHQDGFALWLVDFTESQLLWTATLQQLEQERHARAQDAHLRLALETARMVTWEWVEDKGLFQLSANADAFFGTPPGGLGESMERLLERVSPEEREHIDEAFARVRRAQGPHTFQFHGEWPDGTVHCYEVVGRTFQEPGGPVRVMGVAMDCTERERAQAALREAEERYRLASEATNDVLWDWTPATGRIHWNEACLRLFGYTPEEMGDFSTWEDRLHPDDHEAVTRGLSQRLASGENVWSAEYRFRCKDGVYVDVLDRGRVARDAQGRTTRMIGSMMDITERKRTVERMRHEALFRDRFIGILGHDLRNPLNAISLAVRELRRRGLPEPQELVVQRLESSAGRMANMISDILDLTRARLAGGIPLHLVPASLPAVCRQVMAELQAAWPERTLVLELEGECAGVWDLERLTQVVSNLVGNALEHGPEQEPIFIRCIDQPQRQLLEVSNGGPPIPDALLATLFDPFRQAGPGRPGRRSGLGLGLFIVSELVRAHGGAVTVRSTQEQGTTFTVFLPHDARPSPAEDGVHVP